MAPLLHATPINSTRDGWLPLSSVVSALPEPTDQYHYNPDFSAESSTLSHRLAEEEGGCPWSLSGARKCFVRHFKVILFMLIVTGAIVFGFFYLRDKKPRQLLVDHMPKKPGSFGSHCELNDLQFQYVVDVTANLSNSNQTNNLGKDRSEVNCDLSAHLECDETTMTCRCLATMYYDPARNACLSSLPQPPNPSLIF